MAPVVIVVHFGLFEATIVVVVFDVVIGAVDDNVVVVVLVDVAEHIIITSSK